MQQWGTQMMNACVCGHPYEKHKDKSPRLGFACTSRGCWCKDYEESDHPTAPCDLVRLGEQMIAILKRRLESCDFPDETSAISARIARIEKAGRV